MKEQIHFAHGNGFPSPCYRQLFLQLASDFDCYYIDKVGHSEQFPVTENWGYLVHEVIASIEEQTKPPVYGLGHSLGGVLTLLAALEKPSLFKAIVLLDSPFIGPVKSNMLRIAKMLRMIDRVTPAMRSKARQQHWHNRAQVWAYLKTKDLFKSFTDECLNDYIDFGLQKDEDGYRLRFERAIETEIYRTIPHILPQFQGKLKVPAVLVYAPDSKVVDKFDIRYMKKQFGITTRSIKGTHMFPMEDPKTTAKLIIEALKFSNSSS